MKKIMLALAFLVTFGTYSFAQTTPAKKAPTAASPTKKDGTPDKRFKANKTAPAATTVHTKKDGTPDKRFKENKTK